PRPEIPRRLVGRDEVPMQPACPLRRGRKSRASEGCFGLLRQRRGTCPRGGATALVHRSFGGPISSVIVEPAKALAHVAATRCILGPWTTFGSFNGEIACSGSG